jgi:hypothetical protein
MVTIDAPLGNDDAPIEVAEAQPIRVVSGAASALMPQGALASTWWCTTWVLPSLEAQP